MRHMNEMRSLQLEMKNIFFVCLTIAVSQVDSPKTDSALGGPISVQATTKLASTQTDYVVHTVAQHNYSFNSVEAMTQIGIFATLNLVKSMLPWLPPNSCL